MTVTTGTAARFTLQVDPDAVDRAALRLRGLAERLAEIGGDLGEDFTAISRNDWSGAARDSMTAELSRLGTVVGGFPQRFSDAAAALTTLAGHMRDALKFVGDCNLEWDQLQADYASAERRAHHDYRLTVDELGAAADLPAVDAAITEAARVRDAAIRRAASARDVAGSYTARAVGGAVAALQDEARRTAQALGNAVLPGTGELSSTPVCRGPMPPADLAALLGLTATEQRYREHWNDFASAQDAAEAGRAAAERLEDLEIDEVDPALVDAVARYATNPAYAAGLYDGLGAEAFAQLPWAWAQAFSDFTAGDPFAGRPDERDVAMARLDTLAEGLATTLVTLSHDPARGEDVARDLVAVAASDTVFGGAFGLSVLLTRAEGMDRDVAEVFAVGLYDAERSAGVSPFWQPKVGTQWDVPPALFGSTVWYDPMVAVEELLARDPALAQEFLLGADGHGGTTRTAYLFGERTTVADGGDALGRLLVAATTTRDTGPEGSSAGWRSAEVLSQAMLAMRREDGAYAVPENARDSVGLVLSVYLPEVQNALGQRSLDPGALAVGQLALPGGERAAWAPLLGRDDAAELIAAVVADDQAFAALVAAQEVLLQGRLDELLADPSTAALPPDQLWGRINSIARVNGLSWGAVLDQRNLAGIKDGMDADARRQLMVDLFDAVTGIPPIPASDFVRGISKLAIEQAIDAATSPEAGTSLHGGSQGHARIAAATAWDTAQDQLEHHVVSALFEHGYLDADGPLTVDAPQGTLQIDPGGWFAPDGSLKPVEALTEQQRADLQAWLDHSVVGNVNTTIGAAFDAGQQDYTG